MTVTAGAAQDSKLEWQSLNWKAIEGAVRRLQARIVRAVQQGRWNKVKALQHLLTRSASAKLLAVRRSILRKWLKSGYLEKQVLHDMVSGTLQGGIISPVLANLALDGLQRRFERSFPSSRQRGEGDHRIFPA
jgi:retron-type reverse transcriptase